MSETPDVVVSIAAHPRAKAAIRRTRARVAIATFALVLFLSLHGGVTGQEAAVRALAVWRVIVVQELRNVEAARRERARARAEAAAAAAAGPAA